MQISRKRDSGLLLESKVRSKESNSTASQLITLRLIAMDSLNAIMSFRLTTQKVTQPQSKLSTSWPIRVYNTQTSMSTLRLLRISKWVSKPRTES